MNNLFSLRWWFGGWMLLVLSLQVAQAQVQPLISPARAQYIEAHEHGWVEVAVQIPANMIESKASTPCMLEANLDGEPYLSETLYPSPAASGSIRTGFVLNTPAGQHTLNLSYAKCYKDKSSTSFAFLLPDRHRLQLLFTGQALTLAQAPVRETGSLAGVQSTINDVLGRQGEQEQAIDRKLSTLFDTFLMGVAVIAMLLGLVFLRLLKKKKD
ncbi:hypothetical protein [Leptothrix ochracea]|uniref:hypothetical protein n=1 Tax=Leptothrix ochracea TaxID=735331 RepID=UPI0034E1C897